MTQPVLLPIFDATGRYQLAREWSCFAGVWRVTVPAGFITDGASVPRLFWCAFPPDGLHRAAALAHDWLYAVRGRLDTETLTRDQADGFFLSMLQRTAGIARASASVLWLAVRAFGWRPWSRSAGKPRIEPLRYEMS